MLTLPFIHLDIYNKKIIHVSIKFLIFLDFSSCVLSQKHNLGQASVFIQIRDSCHVHTSFLY